MADDRRPATATDPAGAKKPRGIRLRASLGPMIIPFALIGAIGALDMARFFQAEDGEGGSAQRTVFFNIDLPILFYILFAVLVAVLIGALVQRIRIWRIGKSQSVTDKPGARATNMLTMGAGTSRVVNDRYAGIMHTCIYVSFAMLTLVTLTLAVDDYLPLLFGQGDTEHAFLTGWRYLVFSLVGDVFGVVGLVGVGMALYRRYGTPPPKIDWDRRHAEDMIITGLLGVVLFSGFLVEGFRLAGDEIPAGNESWSYWSPFGWMVAKVFGFLSIDAALNAHAVLWWGHVVAAFGLLGLMAMTKFRHIAFAPANAFFKRPVTQGYLAPMGNFEELTSFGVGRVEDFTWKQLFDADTCVRCGRCTEACPAWTAGQPLSPMAIVQNMRKAMNHAGPLLIAGKDPAEHNVAPLIGPEGEGYIQDESLWACRTCMACVEECPVMIEHVPSIVDMRRYLVMEEARMPETAQGALQNIEQRGHPWRGTQLTRTAWMEQLEERGIEVPAYDGSQEYLYWVGCSGALVERNVPITQAVANLLIEGDVSFGVMGQEETCTGDPARRLGNEFLYATLAEQNAQTLNEKGVKKVITSCPHCFNTFKNEYPDFGGQYEVIHHAEFLRTMVGKGQLQTKNDTDKQITFHDSCYLGRANGVYDAPRDVLASLKGADLIEMPRNKNKGLCCGAGGGNMWMEEKGTRVNHLRAAEAQNTGADIVATACPFCVQMFEDGVPAIEADEDKRIQVFDIAELLEAAVIDGRPGRNKVTEEVPPGVTA